MTKRMYAVTIALVMFVPFAYAALQQAALILG